MRSRTAWRDLTRTEQADQPIELERFESGFRRGRNIIQCLGMLTIGQRDHLDLSGLHPRTHDRIGADESMDASFGQIVDGLHRVLVRHLGHVELFGFQPRGEKQIVRSGNRGIVQFAGFGFDFCRELLDRGNIQDPIGTPSAMSVLVTRAIGTSSFGS